MDETKPPAPPPDPGTTASLAEFEGLLRKWADAPGSPTARSALLASYRRAVEERDRAQKWGQFEAGEAGGAKETIAALREELSIAANRMRETEEALTAFEARADAASALADRLAKALRDAISVMERADTVIRALVREREYVAGTGECLDRLKANRINATASVRDYDAGCSAKGSEP